MMLRYPQPLRITPWCRRVRIRVKPLFPAPGILPMLSESLAQRVGSVTIGMQGGQP